MAKYVGICPKCNEGKLRIKDGRYGPFVSCERYPKCKFSRKLKPNDVEMDEITEDECQDGSLNCWECPYEQADKCFILGRVV